MRNPLLRALLALSALACTAPPALAQAYPAKPVHLIVQFPPGGTPDIYGRILGAELGKLWNQSVVVENRAGATGTIATDHVAKAAPDGYTLLFGANGPIVVVPHLMAKLPYDPVRDLAPITNAIAGGFVLYAHPSVPANNLKELIAWVRANPGKASFASSGNGSPQHLAMEAIRTMAGGLNMVHVPYKGFGQALADVLAGQVHMIFTGGGPSIEFARDPGRLKPMGITTRTRARVLPQIPPIADVLPGYEVLAWYGFLAPAGTPRQVVNRIHADVLSIVRRPDFRERLDKDTLEPIGSTPEQFAAEIKSDLVMWSRIVKSSGVTLN